MRHFTSTWFHTPAGTLLGLSLIGMPNAQADFIADSKGSLEARNFYFNRDFRQEGARDKAEEWAQGFLLRMESSYTAGTVGFGLDALGMAGFKLDSGGGTAGTNLLPADLSGGSQDRYGELGLTAKVRLSNSTLKLGTLQIKDPAVSSNDTRLLPGTFKGGLLSVQEIDRLKLSAGQLTQINFVDSTDYQDMTANRIGGSSDKFQFAGADYQFLPNLTAQYRYSQLEDIYQQNYLGFVHTLDLGAGQSFKSDVRYSRSTEDGNFRDLDNQAFGALFTYSLAGHALGLGYQRMSGDDPFPYIGRSDPYLVNFVQIGDFANIDERSWQARYDYNFAAIGVPGLTFMTRYITGDNVQRTAPGEGKEWERNTDIAYVVQDGTLKGLGLKWRNATVRSNFGNDLDENRLIVSYTMALW
ncbi:outer membrane porin, OprD family [Pseudomonas sp. 43mfcvi1.1]|uniref:OprD family porin n=1 Tax=unclassified Pseudomonas TaxID=196821 RepID=UPI000D6D19B0|nr:MULTISPECIES: OprD family porin [unclassified Pseudomonas]PWJ35162.1 outer membrane OprD family porin [Pseudomonas sp. 43mfcvi1.1]BBH33520.1 porin [Pseudomonas sp. St290]SSB97210.1 outer membrane porin, OprD family [Pseudomonas sp. 43mfcvi1.1]